jgi:hypothetical protein
MQILGRNEFTDIKKWFHFILLLNPQREVLSEMIDKSI